MDTPESSLRIPHAQLGDHIHERYEILNPKRAPTGRQHNERVDVRSIRPAARERALHTILIEERHAILTPRLTHSHERELATTQRVKRMRHTDSPLRNTPIKRSRRRRRRAASRARSGAADATTWSPSRASRTSPSSTRCCWPAARPICSGGSTGERDGRRGMGQRAPAAGSVALRAVRRVRDSGTTRGSEVAGHDPPEPLLRPRRARRAEGQRACRCPGDHDRPRRPSGRASRAAARALWHQREARSLPRAACAQARRVGAFACAGARARARRLARPPPVSWSQVVVVVVAVRNRRLCTVLSRAPALVRARARPSGSPAAWSASYSAGERIPSVECRRVGL